VKIYAKRGTKQCPRPPSTRGEFSAIFLPCFFPFYLFIFSFQFLQFLDKGRARKLQQLPPKGTKEQTNKIKRERNKKE